MKHKKVSRFWIGCIILAVVVCINILLWRVGFSLALLKEKTVLLDQWVQQHYIEAFIGYIVFFIAAMTFWIPVTVLMTLASGYFFGFAHGLIISSLGVSLGCLGSFLISRYLFRDLVTHYWSKPLEIINHELRKFGAYYMVMLHALPLTPTPLLNLLAGVTALSPLTYVWSAFLGMAPALVAYVMAGRRLHEIESVKDVISFELLAVMFILFFVAFVPFFFRKIGMKLPKI